MLLTTKEVAALLRVHPKHVYRLLKRGLPAHRVGDEWRFVEAEALAWARSARTEAVPTESAGTRESKAVTAPPLLAGNGDLALEALLEELGEHGLPLLGHVQADHGTGMELLRRGAVLMAGCHGEGAPPAEGGAGKLSFLHLATRELGLAFPRGKRVRRVSAIVGRRFAGRPPTAGIRARLDEALREEGIDPAEAQAGAQLHRSHRDAVMAVLGGGADLALSSRAWAVRAGLGFFSFASEGYGLAVRAEDLGDGRVVALCERAQGGTYRQRLAGDFGYDVRRTGELRFGAASAPGAIPR